MTDLSKLLPPTYGPSIIPDLLRAKWGKPIWGAVLWINRCGQPVQALPQKPDSPEPMVVEYGDILYGSGADFPRSREVCEQCDRQPELHHSEFGTQMKWLGSYGFVRRNQNAEAKGRVNYHQCVGCCDCKLRVEHLLATQRARNVNDECGTAAANDPGGA